MKATPRRAGGNDIQQVIARAAAGEHDRVYVLLGGERFLLDRATRLLKAAALGDGPSGFNDEIFHGAAALSGRQIVGAARTLPMMARARFVLVRDVDKMATGEQEPIAAYLEDPSESTCFVLMAEKLHAASKLYKAAKASHAIVEAKALKGPAIRRFATEEAKSRGHVLGGRAAEALIDAVGEDLAGIDDALERLSLYVGAGAPIEVDAVSACVSRVAADSIWSLVDAVGLRDSKKALTAVGTLLESREPALRILAMVARQLRIVARMREALASGAGDEDAARAAGAPPFKHRELRESARRFTQRDLATAFSTLAEADLALKGSKRPDERVLEEAILALCSGHARIRERIPRRLRTYR